MYRFWEIKDLFNSFLGEWIIHRSVQNYITAEGKAKYTLDDGNIFYQENIEVNHANSTLSNTASKSFFYILNEEKIIKCFTDRHLFHELKIKNNKIICSNYYCDNDIYHPNYRFINNNNFILSYKVLGPNKNYLIISNYTRIIK